MHRGALRVWPGRSRASAPHRLRRRICHRTRLARLAAEDGGEIHGVRPREGRDQKQREHQKPSGPGPGRRRAHPRTQARWARESEARPARAAGDGRPPPVDLLEPRRMIDQRESATCSDRGVERERWKPASTPPGRTCCETRGGVRQYEVEYCIHRNHCILLGTVTNCNTL